MVSEWSNLFWITILPPLQICPLVQRHTLHTRWHEDVPKNQNRIFKVTMWKKSLFLKKKLWNASLIHMQQRWIYLRPDSNSINLWIWWWTCVFHKSSFLTRWTPYKATVTTITEDYLGSLPNTTLLFLKIYCIILICN